MHAGERHQSKLYPGRIVLFKAEEQKAHYGPAAKLGWGKVALGGVQVIRVPGDHMSLLEKPKVFELANQLRACMEAEQLEAAQKATRAEVKNESPVNAARFENILPLGQES